MVEMKKAFQLLASRRYPWLISIVMMMFPLGDGLRRVCFERGSLSAYAFPVLMSAVANGLCSLVAFYGMAMNTTLEKIPYRKDLEVRIVVLRTLPLTILVWPGAAFFLYSMWRLMAVAYVAPHYKPMYPDVILNIVCVLGLFLPVYALLVLWGYRLSDPSR